MCQALLCVCRPRLARARMGEKTDRCVNPASPMATKGTPSSIDNWADESHLYNCYFWVLGVAGEKSLSSSFSAEVLFVCQIDHLLRKGSSSIQPAAAVALIAVAWQQSVRHQSPANCQALLWSRCYSSRFKLVTYKSMHTQPSSNTFYFWRNIRGQRS